MKPTDGFIRISFQQFYVDVNGDIVSDVNFNATLDQDASLPEAKEYIIDGLRAIGFTFADEDF